MCKNLELLRSQTLFYETGQIVCELYVAPNLRKCDRM